jgi:protein transport protein SEC24
MAAPPNDGFNQYPPQEYDQNYDVDGPASPPLAQTAQQLDAGKKKKRGYATQAFEFGAGGNAAVGGQTPGGIPPGPAGVGANPMGGYPGQQEFQGAYAGSPAAAPYGGTPAPVGYGAPGAAPGTPGVGGYQAPDPYYQGGAAVPGAAPQGVSGITAGMAGMNVAGQPQMQQGAQQARVALNQLYPTDLLNQPFNVSELDLPPPPCILPPNVSDKSDRNYHLPCLAAC